MPRFPLPQSSSKSFLLFRWSLFCLIRLLEGTHLKIFIVVSAIVTHCFSQCLTYQMKRQLSNNFNMKMILHYNKRIIPNNRHYLRNISNQFKDMREGGCAPFVPILDYTLAYSLLLIFTFPGDGFVRIWGKDPCVTLAITPKVLPSHLNWSEKKSFLIWGKSILGK